jgi:hypothetical protein
MARIARKASPLKDIFTRAKWDCWDGTLEQVGVANFTVVGVCGDDPVIQINKSATSGPSTKCVIDWYTGAIKRWLLEA